MDQLADAGVGQIGVDGPGAVTQQRGEVVDVPGLGALQDHGDGRALLGADQVLLQGRHGQQGGNGHVVLVHAPVREDDDIGPVAVGPVAVDEEMVQGLFQGRIFIIENGDGLHPEARSVHGLDLHQVQVGEDGVVDLEDVAVLRAVLEQVAVGAHIDRGIGDALLADGVDGRVGDLGEHLLEVAEQGLMLLREHGQGDIHAHGGGGLLAVPGHGEDDAGQILIGIGKGPLEPLALGVGEGLHLFIGHRQILEVDQVLIQPLAVGLPGGIVGLEIVVLDDLPGLGIHQQHLARAEPVLLDHHGRIDVQHAHLGGENQIVVPGHVVPGGPEAVAVQQRAHQVAVGEDDGGRTVPGLHHRGVVVIEIPALPVDVLIVPPGLGN